jgi:sulfur carrier protein
MRVQLNGEPHQCEPTATLIDVVSTLTNETRGVAVALDGAVVPRSDWPRTLLSEGARVEVLVATQGG